MSTWGLVKQMSRYFPDGDDFKNHYHVGERHRVHPK